MARPERNNVDYFPHSVEHGRKMFYLRSKYGNDGYAVWFMLLEELGKADFHYLDLKDDVQLMYLSSEFKVNESILLEIIEVLVKFGEFDSQLWNERIIYSQKYVDSIEDAYSRRNNNIVNKHSLCTTLIELKRLKKEFLIGSKPQSRVKDIKEEYKQWRDESKNEKYQSFVTWLLSENLEKIYKLPKDHITEKWFITIYGKAKGNGELLKTKINAMEATKDLLKRYDSFARTLLNWIK